MHTHTQNMNIMFFRFKQNKEQPQREHSIRRDSGTGYEWYSDPRLAVVRHFEAPRKAKEIHRGHSGIGYEWYSS